MSKSLSPSYKLAIQNEVNKFNQENKTNIKTTIRGIHVYISVNDEYETKVGRLTYNGNPNNWSFAIYKYSSQKYHPDELGYPGFFNRMERYKVD